jgi:hypothetical protein
MLQKQETPNLFDFHLGGILIMVGWEVHATPLSALKWNGTHPRGG